MRAAQSQANQTYSTAAGNAGQFGAGASGISSNLVPFLTQRLTSPQGYAPQDLTAMLSAALGGVGGATSGIAGQEQQQTARTRNDAGFSTALTEAARQRTKTLAQTGEQIAADNAGVKLQQQDQAGRMLAGLYGTDVGAQNDSLRTADQATQTGIAAGQSGWLQNLSSVFDILNKGGNTVLKALGKG